VYSKLVALLKYFRTMTTITIQTNDTYGVKLYRKLKADKNLNKVVIGEPVSKSNSLKEVELVLPGRKLRDEELISFLEQASRGKNISLNTARKRTASKT
jgi:hypothetical protein